MPYANPEDSLYYSRLYYLKNPEYRQRKLDKMNAKNYEESTILYIKKLFVETPINSKNFKNLLKK